jgi:hypothetical protein
MEGKVIFSSDIVERIKLNKSELPLKNAKKASLNYNKTLLIPLFKRNNC